MRTATFEGTKKIYYPDEVAFCFNPNILKVETSNEVTVVIKVEESGLKGVFDATFDRTFRITKKPWYTDKRQYDEGIVELDLSPYMRALFDIDRKSMVVSHVIMVNVKTSAAEFNFQMTGIWGAINIGEEFNPPRTVTWFSKFPFTVTIFDNGIKHVDVVEVPETVKVVEDDSECGVYLRWIDRHGFYQYWLFQQGENENKSDEYGDRLYDNFSDGQYGYYGVSRSQGKTMEKSFKACAPLVDKRTFGVLLSVHSSPLVDMYVGETWVPVNVSAATTVDNGNDLQDFEITVTLPDIVSQVL